MRIEDPRLRSTIRPAAFVLAIAVVLAMLAVPAPPALAWQEDEEPVTIENVWVGLAADANDQAYKIGAWTPVRVDLLGGPERFQGYLRVEVPDDGGVPTFVYRRVEVGARAFASFLTYVRPGDIPSDVRVAIFEEGRRRPRDVAVNDRAAWLDPQIIVLAVIGRPGGVELLPTMAEFRVENALQTSRIHVDRVRVPEGVPDRWYGYDAAEALILDTNDDQAMAALQDFRNLALKEWVRNGGHLVVTLGDDWQQASAPEGFLRELLPALPTGQTRTNDLGAIESFTASNTPITTPEDPPVAVTTLAPVEGRGAQAILDDRSVGGPLIVRGQYGLGRVTVVGLNVDQRPFVDWPDRGDFWAKVLDLDRDTPLTAGAGSNAAFYNYEIRDLSSYLHRSLEQFEGVTLVPFGWVAFFVFVYILMIGPGDYFFLKKVLKRMELTWITFPTIVIAVSLIAYATAYAIKGTDLRINRVDVVDLDQSFGAPGGQVLARGTSFATIFSPQNRDYDITALPRPLDTSASVDEPSANPPARPTRAEEVLMTWFGVAEDRFGAMGNSGGMSLTSNGYSYQSFGDDLSSQPPEQLNGVRVPIWTTKALMGTWFDAAAPALDAELRDLGADRLEGTITNRLDRPLNNPVLVYGGEVYRFSRPIAPGETVQVEAAENRNLSGYLEDISRRIGSVYSYQQDARIGVSRSELVRALSFARAGQGRGLKANVVLDDLDLSGQLELDRPILLADLDGPASTIVLNGAEPESAKLSQTTVLRVLLPPTTPE